MEATQMTQTIEQAMDFGAALEAWQKGNDSGNGEPLNTVDLESGYGDKEFVRACRAAEIDIVKDWTDDANSTTVYLVNDAGMNYLVCDCNGPWAIPVEVA